jgi:hypothetical protein
MNKLAYIVKDRRSRNYALIIGAVYLLLYLVSIGNLTIIRMPETLKLRLIDDWQSKMFKPIAPFLWESIAVLYIYGGLTLFISVPNILIALFLTFLVFLNIATAVYSYNIMPIRPGLKGLIGMVPSLFTGFVCCVPTFIITLGAISSSFTVFFIEIRQFLLPASILIMALNLIWSLRSLKEGLIEIYEKEKREGTKA